MLPCEFAELNEHGEGLWPLFRLGQETLKPQNRHSTSETAIVDLENET